MIHPHTELRYINSEIGYGVFASQFIPKGTVVYVKDSLEIELSYEEYMKHTEDIREAIDKYSYIDHRGMRILSWDFGKYVNHCCDCNTMSTGYGFEIAIKDIQPGDQITDEYGLFNIDEHFEVQCGKTCCRKVVKPDDVDLLYQKWDEQIKSALVVLPLVEQPMASFIDHETRKELDAYFANASTYKSVLNLKCRKTNGHSKPEMVKEL